MANSKFINGGASSIGDLAKAGGDVQDSMTNTSLINYGPGMWSDLAKQGGNVIGLEITGTPVEDGTINVAYAGFTVDASGGVPPYTYSLVGTWPAGIAIDDETGAVSGTPTESGTFEDLSVRATDDDSATADLPTFTLTIAAA